MSRRTRRRENRRRAVKARTLERLAELAGESKPSALTRAGRAIRRLWRKLRGTDGR